MADKKAAESLENQWGCTEMKISKCSFTWTIKNFKCFQDKKELKSAVFQVAGKTSSKWHLQFKPKNEDEKNKEFCSLYLYLDSCLSSEIEARFKFSILTPERARKATENFKIESPHTFKPGSGLGFAAFIRRDLLFDEAKGFADGENMSILCELAVFDEIVAIATVNTTSCVTVPKCELSENFENLFENKSFSDVTLTAGGCEYRVHKNILAARSKVFAGMFAHDMEESRSNRVNIPDISGVVCKEMLHFIYTGKVSNINEVAEGLLAAAEKYELIRLKAMCEEALARRLCVENAAAKLILADLHGAGQLKAQAITFITNHIFDVLLTDGWKNLSPSHLHLLTETHLAIAKP